MPPVPSHRDNPETTHEEPVYLFTDKAVTHGEGTMTAPTAPAHEGHPLLAGLLAEVPRIQRELPGWAAGFLVPALNTFPNDATDAQVAAALANLREVMYARADIDPWLRDIADLGKLELAGNPQAMTPASQLGPRIELSDRYKNRTVVEQARQLVAALTATPTKAEGRPTPPPPRPDPK
jgi:hypothetical protein